MVEVAKRVSEMAFVTQLNNREAMIPLLNELQDAIFKWEHRADE